MPLAGCPSPSVIPCRSAVTPSDSFSVESATSSSQTESLVEMLTNRRVPNDHNASMGTRYQTVHSAIPIIEPGMKNQTDLIPRWATIETVQCLQ